MTAAEISQESIRKVDLLLGQATMLIADRWDDVADTVQEAMGIALLMAAAHLSTGPTEVPGLAGLNLSGCVDEAWREVQSWDLALAATLPDLGRLRVLLTDLRRELAVTPGPRG